MVSQTFSKYNVQNLSFFCSFQWFTYQNIRLRFYVCSLLFNQVFLNIIFPRLKFPAIYLLMQKTDDFLLVVS